MAKILIVDDEEMMLMIARHVLSTKYEVITAETGAEAIELFEREQPDLILSDLMMPEMDGYELHRILQEKSAESVPIIFMTADENEESEIKGFEMGAADYIHKPVRPDVLLRRVGNIIDNLDKIHGLKAAAQTDSLTKLLNKAASQEKIGEMIKNSTSGALLMIDLDNFKPVNDIYGHSAGDKILIKLAELIKSTIRENDLAGRMGGDEFIVFLENVSSEITLKAKTTYLNEEIIKYAKKLFGETMNIPLSVSIGAVFVPNAGRDFQTLYIKADKALYEVKKHGKQGISIFNEQNNADKSILSGISQMRLIMDERNTESGAYFVEFGVFKKIYQLLLRMATSYNKTFVLFEFTLADETFAEEFKEILIKTLRKSDCVTKSGENKFLVLLVEITATNSKKIKEKVLSQVKNTEVFFESDII